MKVLLDIRDDKAPYLLEVLKSMSFVRKLSVPDNKAMFLEELQEAVVNLKLAKRGKIKAKPLSQLLDEL